MAVRDMHTYLGRFCAPCMGGKREKNQYFHCRFFPSCILIIYFLKHHRAPTLPLNSSFFEFLSTPKVDVDAIRAFAPPQECDCVPEEEKRESLSINFYFFNLKGIIKFRAFEEV